MAGGRRPKRHPKYRVAALGLCPFSRKQRYADEPSARKAMNQIIQENADDPGRELPTRVYQCLDRKRGCGDWHLTSRDEREGP